MNIKVYKCAYCTWGPLPVGPGLLQGVLGPPSFKPVADSLLLPSTAYFTQSSQRAIGP